MLNKQLFTAIYKATVIPVTCCTVPLSVYSRGYSDQCDRMLSKPPPPYTIYTHVISLLESGLLGYCIGITYPIGIPGIIAYIYLTET